jgi:hypothetical protein
VILSILEILDGDGESPPPKYPAAEDPVAALKILPGKYAPGTAAVVSDE